MHDIQFSDAQDLGALNSTGKVSDYVFDMELEKSGGNTILTNDQVVGVLNITIAPLAGQTAAEGMNIRLRSCDNADMTSSSIDLGIVFVSMAEMVAGCVKNIQVTKNLTQKFLGVWYHPHTSTLVTGQVIDAHWSIAPLTENDTIQKVPSR